MSGDFLWGAATSAYQIEGGTHAGGRGISVWDTFAAQPGAIRDGTSGSVACDFYRRYPEDIALMRTLGLDAFRFSISWPRVLPAGRGAVNRAGLDFYDRLVDALLAAGIQPFPTLYHWDLPQALEDAGGWPHRDTAEAFADYSALVARRLGDRVSHWVTHNEPYCSSWLGYVEGVHAPGRMDADSGAAAVHHVLYSHGLALQAIRAARPLAQVGIVLDAWPQHPASDSDADAAAAWEADAFRNRLFFDPLLRGAYPDEAEGRLSLPVRDGDLEAIAAPLDFLGINCYSRNVVRAGPGGCPQALTPDGPVTAMGWEVYPDGLYEVLTRVHRDYDPPPLYVTENGAAFDDAPGPDGRIRDAERIAYLESHLAAVARAVAAGVPVRGYFVWSLLDNFEWAQGYAKRFGIVYVDYVTLERIPKDSFFWFRDRIAARYSAAATR